MTTIINLEVLPQLVMEKITSFLNHKHLLALEQVSRKLKSAVDAHFSITDHLIIGSLPQMQEDIGYDEATNMEKKCLNGFLQMIKRCGIRLRTIQTPPYHFWVWRYRTYLNHFFASAEVSEKCPNLENIIHLPNMDLPILHDNSFRQQKVLLDVANTNIYASNIKLCKGKSCKLRSIVIDDSETEEEIEDIESILNLYSNIEQLALYGRHKNHFKLLPKLIENGLKDLHIGHPINFQNLQKYCNVSKDLRTLLLYVDVSSNEDIAALNQLHVPKNVKLQLDGYFDDADAADHCFAQLSDNIRNSIIFCEIYQLSDYSLMTKLNNLQECCIRRSEQLKVMAEGSFPELKIIHDGNTLCHQTTNNCVKGSCDLQIFLRQILINKGNQLTFISITCNSCILIDVVWKALKHCTGAKTIKFERLVINSPLSITAEDVKVVCDLPNLQHYMFSIDEDDNCSPLRELMDSVVKEHEHFHFEHKYEDDGFYCIHWFSLYKVHV